VALRQLLDLQKEVITFAREYNMAEIPITVHPRQLYGIELNPYAHELAQVTVWIGYIQWRYENGLTGLPKPILEPLDNIKHMDAILAFDEQGQPVEPAWPEAEVVIGNPPFLGDKKMRSELGDDYVTSLRQLYSQRIPGQSDLVCYWFEQARHHIETKKLQRAGLLATNSIRGGANQTVLKRIKETGDIFMAWSDRKWILDGAAVRISMVGFDDGSEKKRSLDKYSTQVINSDLTDGVNLTTSKKLAENSDCAFIGSQKGGAFDISHTIAQTMLQHKNSSPEYKNATVVRPWINGSGITGRPQNKWIIDFGVDMTEAEAQRYKLPFQHVLEKVKHVRDEVNSETRTTQLWWLHQRSRPEMRQALSNLARYIATPRVAKHRLFVWQNMNVLPDSAVVAIARDDDYFFGVLHSKLHELWALRLGTALEDRPRYTPTTTFETFPFPFPPGHEPAEDERVFDIAEAARQLDTLRVNWLNPTEETLKTRINAKQLSKMTLTNLYNALELYRTRPHWSYNDWWDGIVRVLKFGDMDKILTLDLVEQLHDTHTQLDRAVLRAYGWPETISDDEILSRLLALNLERVS
jgi:type II restriction/modification system DNA methylase subunit YeeA